MSVRNKASPRSAIGPMVLIGCFVSLLWLERRRPLRRMIAPGIARLGANLLVGAGAAVVAAAIEAPLADRLSLFVERRRFGLVHRLGLPRRGERLAALLLLDYTLYHWHVMLHRLPALWRWHRVHHADKDLDVSTALRFHALEMLWSVPWRVAQVLLIGVDRVTLDLWRRLTLAEVFFHHANLRLPEAVEGALGRLVVTPRQHGIHHSDMQAHQHANFSSGLAVWDCLHATARRDVAQAAITIGLPAEDACS